MKMKLDNILQLDVIQKIKDKGIKIYSHNRDDYMWQNIISCGPAYDTYNELNRDISNNDEDIGYFFKKDIFNNYYNLYFSSDKNAKYIAYINVFIKKCDNWWQVRVFVDYKHTFSVFSPIEFKTRDEAAKAVEKWFDTYIFEDKDNNTDRNNELSQNNDLLDRICNILR